VRSKRLRWPTESEWWRAGGVVGSMVVPLVVVLSTAETLGSKVAAELSNKAAGRLENGESLDAVLNDLTDPSIIINAILLVYLAWGAAVAAVGTGMRAYAHNDDGLKSLDLAGKLVAVSAAVIVGVGGMVRLLPSYGGKFPAWIYLIVLGLAVLLFAFSLFVGRKVMESDLRVKQAKDSARDEAVISAAVSRSTTELRSSPDDMAADGQTTSGPQPRPGA
jgi:hypothetical protein